MGEEEKQDDFGDFFAQCRRRNNMKNLIKGSAKLRLSMDPERRNDLARIQELTDEVGSLQKRLEFGRIENTKLIAEIDCHKRVQTVLNKHIQKLQDKKTHLQTRDTYQKEYIKALESKLQNNSKTTASDETQTIPKHGKVVKYRKILFVVTSIAVVTAVTSRLCGVSKK